MNRDIQKYCAVLLCITFLFQCFTNEPAYAASGSMKYYICTPLSTADDATASSIVNYCSQMGYSSAKSYYQSASTIYNNMPNSKIVIIHGHGNANLIECRISTGTVTSRLYANDSTSGYVSLSNYSSNQLSSCRLVAYIACNSHNMASMTYNKGAKYSIGFNITVTGGEDYINAAMMYMKNGYSISTSLTLADTYFHSNYGCAGSNCPAHSNHRVQYGTDTTIN